MLTGRLLLSLPDQRGAQRRLDLGAAAAVHAAGEAGGGQTAQVRRSALPAALPDLVRGGQARGLQRPEEPLPQDRGRVPNLRTLLSTHQRRHEQ